MKNSNLINGIGSLRTCGMVLLALAVAQIVPSVSVAGHHFESKLAQEHPQFDLTDVFAFRASDPGKSVLIMVGNPSTKPGVPDFGKNGLYNFHFGFDRELKKGRTFTFKFDGKQMEMAWLDSADAELGKQGKIMSKGELGTAVECPTGIRWWAGAIKEPFAGNGIGLGGFKAAAAEGKFSPELFNNGEQANALFAGKSASAIVMEVPNKYLGRKIFYYATSAMYDHDHWHQVNRIGHVLLPHLYLDTEEHNNAENEGRPVTDKMRREWVKDVIERFAKVSGAQKNPSEYAEKMASVILPDVVPYTIGTEAHYGVHHLNGRKLSDDAMDTAVHLLCGRHVEDYVRPSGNYSDSFPYVIPSK